MVEPAEILVCHQQWRHAASLGGASARHAASQSLHGCHTALLEISRELAALDYPVTDLILPCHSDIDNLVATVLNKTNSRIPAVVVEFWKTVGQLAFTEFDGYEHVEFWEQMGVKSEYCDGLFVEGCTPDWVESITDEYLERKDDGEDFDEVPFVFGLSADGYHKDNISGGVPYGVRAGHDWLPTWENFSWVKRPRSAPAGPLDFLGYLRTCVLECAGFPGLLGDAAFEPVRQRLLRNVKAF